MNDRDLQQLAIKVSAAFIAAYNGLSPLVPREAEFMLDSSNPIRSKWLAHYYVAGSSALFAVELDKNGVLLVYPDGTQIALDEIQHYMKKKLQQDDVINT